MTPDATIFCDLTAIKADEREEHVLSAVEVIRAKQEILDLPDGYALRMPNQEGMFMALARFVENERRCCPFYRFAIEVEPNNGSLWLRLTGGDDVKALLRGVLGSDQDTAILSRFQTGGDARLTEVVTQSLARLAGMLPSEDT